MCKGINLLKNLPCRLQDDSLVIFISPAHVEENALRTGGRWKPCIDSLPDANLMDCDYFRGSMTYFIPPCRREQQ